MLCRWQANQFFPRWFMDREELLTHIKDGHFFSVTFVKRTNGEIRKLNGRIGVTKGVKFVGAPYNPADYGLVTVWDAQVQGYRNIPADAVKELRCNRRVWIP